MKTVVYLTPKESEIINCQILKGYFEYLDPEAVRTFRIKEAWLNSAVSCHKSTPAAKIKKTVPQLFSHLNEDENGLFMEESLPEAFREVRELCLGCERDGGKLMLNDIIDNALVCTYMFRFNSGDGISRPLLFYPVSVSWANNDDVIVVGIVAHGDTVYTGTVRILENDASTWFRIRGNGIKCRLNPQNPEKWECFCNVLGVFRPETSEID